MQIAEQSKEVSTHRSLPPHYSGQHRTQQRNDGRVHQVCRPDPASEIEEEGQIQDRCLFILEPRQGGRVDIRTEGACRQVVPPIFCAYFEIICPC